MLAAGGGLSLPTGGVGVLQGEILSVDEGNLFGQERLDAAD